MPIKPRRAGIYVCGPTVYNFMHVGNARVYVVFDVLRRYLEMRGFEVNYVQNFTDIDDKIIQKAADEGADFSGLAQRYIDEFLVDTDGLNVVRASHYPRVTQEIDGIISLVETLISKGFAYEKNGTVYFISHKANKYGKLSKKNIDELEAGARVEANPEKLHPSDFVLWKAAKDGEPFWDSPWGRGRPGWHIECSVMARKYIGETVDIHAGGTDLMFPHHENEIAQSEAELDAPFVNYWLHNEMLLFDNKKMSKSAGGFFLVRDVAKAFSYEVLRFYLLSVHYRSPLNFSEDLMKSAAAGLERIRNCRRNIMEKLGGLRVESAMTEPSREAMQLWQDFEEALDDDLNTANAISVLFGVVSLANSNMDDLGLLRRCLRNINDMCGVLGIKLDAEASQEIDTAEIESLIAQRDEAKAAKNWTLADELRDKLITMGITIKDTREGTKWHLTNS